MTDKLLIDRVLLQELIDDVSDYAESRSFKKVEWQWRTELLEKARALLAAGASEGQADATGCSVTGLTTSGCNGLAFKTQVSVLGLLPIVPVAAGTTIQVLAIGT